MKLAIAAALALASTAAMAQTTGGAPAPGPPFDVLGSTFCRTPDGTWGVWALDVPGHRQCLTVQLTGSASGTIIAPVEMCTVIQIHDDGRMGAGRYPCKVAP